MPLYNCAGGNGGGGGTSDYAQLSNLPQINNTTLLGNKSASDLGLVGAVAGKGLSANDYTNADKAIVDGVTSALAGKADASSVPTKTSDLTNDSGFITNLVNNLLNYYLKSETYSKTEVDTIVSAITTLDIQAVNTLPTTNISTTTIYLVPKQDPQVPDVKDEYINLDGTTSGWELIGNTQIDLSNYVTTSDLTTALQSYASKAYVDGLVGILSALTTTDKSDCVAAINEVNDFAKSMMAPSTLLTSSDDLNSVLTAGVYRTEGTSVPAHAIGNNHIIWVIKQGATNYTRYLQVMYSFNSKEMYFRQTTDAGSTWSNWTLISSEDQIESLTLRSDATAVNLFNNARVTKSGKLVIVDFDIRLSSVPASDLTICDYVFPTSKSTLRVSGQVTPENATAKGLAVRIDATTHKLIIRGGDANVVYFVRLVYLAQ